MFLPFLFFHWFSSSSGSQDRFYPYQIEVVDEKGQALREPLAIWYRKPAKTKGQKRKSLPPPAKEDKQPTPQRVVAPPDPAVLRAAEEVKHPAAQRAAEEETKRLVPQAAGMEMPSNFPGGSPDDHCEVRNSALPASPLIASTSLVGHRLSLEMFDANQSPFDRRDSVRNLRRACLFFQNGSLQEWVELQVSSHISGGLLLAADLLGHWYSSDLCRYVSSFARSCVLGSNPIFSGLVPAVAGLITKYGWSYIVKTIPVWCFRRVSSPSIPSAARNHPEAPFLKP